MVFRECRERLSIKRDILLLECAYELRVGEAEWAHAGVDAEREELAEIALLRAAVLEGVRARMLDGLLCHALLRLSVEAVAFRLCKDVLATLVLQCSSFDACHIS